MEDGVVQQNAMVANPNQVWFPHVINVRQPDEVDPRKYSYDLFTAPNSVLADVVTNEKPMAGEVMYYNSTMRHVTIIEVLEEKPAAGDWSGEFWKGVKPTWYRCLAELSELPQKKSE